MQANEPGEPTVEPTVSEAQPETSKQAEKNPAAVALGRLGGRKGGLARAKKLSRQRRTEIARKAALARWARWAKRAKKRRTS